MTTTPTLTGRDIGEAENAIRALLDRLLEEAGVSFPEWTVLFTLDGTGPVPRSELVRRQAHGLKVPEAAAMATVDGLRSSGLLTPIDQAQGAGGPSRGGDDPRLTLTAAGEAMFRPIRRAVFQISDELYGDLPPADAEATRRTLAEVTRRANALLAAGG
jgi:DNA-binding MarR family transcriptional regulator